MFANTSSITALRCSDRPDLHASFLTIGVSPASDYDGRSTPGRHAVDRARCELPRISRAGTSMSDRTVPDCQRGVVPHASGAKRFIPSSAPACHGPDGRQGRDKLAGPPGERADRKTVGNYWPYATTLFDYIRRAMPPDRAGQPGRCKEVYALTAYILYLNSIIRRPMKKSMPIHVTAGSTCRRAIVSFRTTARGGAEVR